MMILLCVSFLVSLSENTCMQQKTLLDYTNLFSPNECKKNEKIMYKFFKDKYVKSRV